MATVYAIPKPTEPLLDQFGKLSTPWYNYLRTRFGDAAADDIAQQLADIETRLAALEADEGTDARIIGPASVTVLGTLADGLVQVLLDGDEQEPFPATFYGNSLEGQKGWQILTPDIIPSPHALYFVDENGNYLRDENGNLLVADLKAQSSEVRVDRLPGSTYSTLQEYISLMTSPGLVTGGAIQNLGSGNIRITAGTAMIRDADDETAPLYFADFPQTDFVVPADQDTRYFGLVYTAPGSVVVEMRLLFDWDKDSEIPLGSVVRFNGTTVVTDNPYLMADPITNIIQRFDAIGPAQRDNSVGGLVLGETGTRNITVTAGRIWARLSDFLTVAKNSSVDPMATVYYNGTNLTFTTGVTQWDNARYNNLGTGTLDALAANRYANLWFFMSIDGSQYGFAYGTAEYTTLAAAAEEGVPPYLNQDFFGQALLLGRLIFRNGDPTASVIESAFTRAFTTSPVTNHNDLAGLQGGTTNEYFHLTAAEHTGLLSWAAEDPADYALITQAITNGDTTHAPSGDAVFDALATKEPVITSGTTAQMWRGDKTFSTSFPGCDLVVQTFSAERGATRKGIEFNSDAVTEFSYLDFHTSNSAYVDTDARISCTNSGSPTTSLGDLMYQGRLHSFNTRNTSGITGNRWVIEQDGNFRSGAGSDNLYTIGTATLRALAVHTFQVNQYGARFETGVVTPAQLTANTDNWAVTGISTTMTIRASTDASRNLTGIASPTAGQMIRLINVGAFDLVLIHDATSTAANRFLLPNSASLTLNPNDSVSLWYDSASSRWRAIGV